VLALAGKTVKDTKSNLIMENKLTPILVICILVLCISCKRSQHSSWLSRMDTRGFQN